MKPAGSGGHERLGLALSVLAAGLVAGGCGASGPAQRAPRPSVSSAGRILYQTLVTSARFPARQRLAQAASLVIVVRNPGTRALPDVAVTITNPRYGTSVQPFATYLNMRGLESHSRPVWVVDQAPGPCGFSCRAGGPGAAVTPETHTWALGRLAPGASTTFRWAVTPVMTGRFAVHYAVSPSLNSSRSAPASGQPAPAGTFQVQIVSAPQPETVSDSGAIVKSG